jgi:rare lipoprotein A (peptidoglycan hydrolase)
MVVRVRYPQRGFRKSLAICALGGAVAGSLLALVAGSSSVQADADLSRQTVSIPAANAQAGSPTAASWFKPTASNTSPSAAGARADARFAPGADGKPHRIGILHGIASWYGGVFDGRKTANGEIFDETALTACAPDLPFGTLVRVINRRNKRSVVVRINDRGDLVHDDRIIDLSRAAAQKLAMTERGIARVDVEVLSLGERSTTQSAR